MKSRQESGRALICLAVFITIATLVSAGCTGSAPENQSQVTTISGKQSEQPAAGTPTAPVTVKAPEKPATVRPTPAPVLSTGIMLDPIGDVSDSQKILITGTTSLPAGTELLWQLMPDTGKPPTGTIRGVTTGNGWVVKGDGRSNRISLDVGMAGDDVRPGKWVALVGEMKGNFTDLEIGDHYGYASFTLK